MQAIGELTGKSFNLDDDAGGKNGRVGRPEVLSLPRKPLPSVPLGSVEIEMSFQNDLAALIHGGLNRFSVRIWVTRSDH